MNRASLCTLAILFVFAGPGGADEDAWTPEAMLDVRWTAGAQLSPDGEEPELWWDRSAVSHAGEITTPALTEGFESHLELSVPAPKGAR